MAWIHLSTYWQLPEFLIQVTVNKDDVESEPALLPLPLPTTITNYHYHYHYHHQLPLLIQAWISLKEWNLRISFDGSNQAEKVSVGFNV